MPALIHISAYYIHIQMRENDINSELGILTHVGYILYQTALSYFDIQYVAIPHAEPNTA